MSNGIGYKRAQGAPDLLHVRCACLSLSFRALCERRLGGVLLIRDDEIAKGKTRNDTKPKEFVWTRERFTGEPLGDSLS